MAVTNEEYTSTKLIDTLASIANTKLSNHDSGSDVRTCFLQQPLNHDLTAEVFPNSAGHTLTQFGGKDKNKDTYNNNNNDNNNNSTNNHNNRNNNNTSRYIKICCSYFSRIGSSLYRNLKDQLCNNKGSWDKVGTHEAARRLKEIAEECRNPTITNKWNKYKIFDQIQ